MKVSIVSPEKVLFSGEADCISVPGSKGQFEILNRHAPIISCLTAGKIECKGGQPYIQNIKGGFIEVSQNEISICAEV